LLEELEQLHILKEYHDEKRTEDERKAFLNQINNLERIYP
jgi:hypothetical protein